MDWAVKDSIVKLTLILVAAKILMLAVVVAVPVEPVADLIGLPRDAYSHNWRALNWTHDARPLAQKLGYTFDSKWYVDISRKWYVLADPDQRFLPNPLPGFDKSKCLYTWLFMYPLFIRLFSLLMDPVFAGLVVANVSSLVAVALFYLISLDYLDGKQAFIASVLFALYPYNLLTGTATFSEPLFLVFALLSWIFLGRRNTLAAGVLLMFASLTRIPGLVIFPIYALILLRRQWGKGKISQTLGGVVALNVFAIPALYWMFVQLPFDTGRTYTEIRSYCAGYQIVPGVALLEASSIGLLFFYFAVLGAYYLRYKDKDLLIYSVVFLLLHISVRATGGSIGRYVGAVWPLFIYYGGKLDGMDARFYSAVFLALGAVMFELHANMVTWI